MKNDVAPSRASLRLTRGEGRAPAEPDPTPTPADSAAVAELRRIGFKVEDARAQVRRHGAERVRAVVTWCDYRSEHGKPPDAPTGWVMTALAEDWAVPSTVEAWDRDRAERRAEAERKHAAWEVRREESLHRLVVLAERSGDQADADAVMNFWNDCPENADALTRAIQGEDDRGAWFAALKLVRGPGRAHGWWQEAAAIGPTSPRAAPGG